MAFKSWRSYEEFEQEVKTSFRYVFCKDTREFLAEVQRTAEEMGKVLQPDTLLWRAQVGHDWRLESDEVGEVEYPFPPERMFPPKSGATEGRANPKGIPCLYTATSEKTAVAEVRPWVGALVSIAAFRTTKEMRIVDCTLHGGKIPFFFKVPSGFYEPEEAERNEAVWAHINNAFSRPLANEARDADYAPTQILAEQFRSRRFDGIGFKSSLGDGYNVALFDVGSARLEGCMLHKIEKVHYEHSQAANSYSVRQR